MRIRNKTEWDTKDVRRFFQEVKRRSGITNGGVRVDIRYTGNHVRRGVKWLGVEQGLDKSRAIHGRASINGDWIRMTLPRDKIDLITLAQVFWHELQHNAGLEHSDMQDWWTLSCEWANEFPINKSPTTREVTMQQKLDHAREMLAKNRRRLKLLSTVASKWQRRVSFYERKLAAKVSNE